MFGNLNKMATIWTYKHYDNWLKGYKELFPDLYELEMKACEVVKPEPNLVYEGFKVH